MNNFVALPLRRFFPKRYRPGNLGTWSGHLPFASDLIAEIRPRVFVELGTQYGESYFGFCQAIKENNVQCQCTAVDTWQGDEHAGFYGDDVLENVETYNSENYSLFSRLLRKTFDEATAEFDVDSIDLLHIDGLHTYEAVKHDFETWFPKVKPGGVVLLHDIDVRHADFEVWRFWEELAREYAHFDFRHWWGLGVVVKPGGAQPLPAFLKLLTEADSETAENIRRQYHDAADLLDFRERKPKTAQAAADADRPYLQIFPSLLKFGFTEKDSIIANVEGGVWENYLVELPGGAPGGAIRIDPVNHPAWVEISAVAVRDGADTTLLKLDADQIRKLPCLNQIMPVGSGDQPRFFSWGKDPQLQIDLPASVAEQAPLFLDLTMRVGFGLEEVREAVLAQQAQGAPTDTQALDAQIEPLRLAQTALQGRVTALQEQIRLLQMERAASSSERAQLQTQEKSWHAHAIELRAALNREDSNRTRLEWDLAIARTHILDREKALKKLGAEQEAAALREEQLNRLLLESQTEARNVRDELASKDKALLNLQRLSAAHQARVEGLTESLSWRITAPLRAVAGSFLKE